MKKKFSKILGVGLTLALLCSLLLTAAPVSALSVPEVAVDPDEISPTVGVYTITFQIIEDLDPADTITVKFPEDTVVAAVPTVTIEGWCTPTLAYRAVTAPSAARDADDEQVVELTWTTDTITSLGTVKVTFTAGITNPTAPGDDYTLEVQTSEEDTYVESEEYEIKAPVVGGFVYVYNPSDILLATFGGKYALNASNAYHDDDDLTITVGPGTYELTGNITLSGEDLTLESAEGAADTIIDAATFGIIILTNTGVTIDGFTIDDAGTAVNIDAEDATVTNCVITDATVDGIEVDLLGVDATVSDNIIVDCATGISFTAGAPTDLGDVDITGNEITEANTNGAIVFDGGNVDIDITGNTITGNEVSGIFFVDGSTVACDDIDIVGNTISENEGIGIEIWEDTDAPTDLIIKENVIADNEDEGILMASWTPASNYIMFNDISGNNSTADDVTNTSGAAANARFNWWGSAVEDDIDVSADVDYEPWLMGEQATVVSGYAVAVGDVSSLSGKTDAGVAVSGMADDTPLGADIISAAKYIANPEGAIDDAIGFYDVYVNLDSIIAATTLGQVSAKLKFYDAAITSTSTVSFWTGDFWAECLEDDVTARAGLVWVTVTEDTSPGLEELDGTAFVVVAGPEVAEVFGAPTIAAPTSGADDVSLTPTFAWGAVADADGYYFELADNANFVLPLVKLDGDTGRLIVTAYAHVGELPYSTPYYWRVKAVSGTTEAGDLLESDWASAVFITMDEPVEPTPPVVIEEAPELPDITIEQPDITITSPDIVVPLPDVVETPITPSWIYVIIGVGAVLVIALLVLIVRTRRVA